MCIYTDRFHLTPPLTHHQTTAWPSLWHPQHWSLGVLCAPLEWPCWALPSSPLGCMPHVSKCGIFIDFHVISPAEQAHTSSGALIISLDDFHCPAIDFQVAITFFIKLSSTFSIFAHTHHHTTTQPHNHTTTSPPHGHPIPGPWGCYVHTWNGQALPFI